MAENRQQPNRQKKIQPQGPSDEKNVPVAPANTNPVPDAIFSSLAQYISEPHRTGSRRKPRASRSSLQQRRSRMPTPMLNPDRLSRVQMILVAAIIVIGVIFVYMFVRQMIRTSSPNRPDAPQPPDRYVPPAPEVVEPVTQKPPAPVPQPAREPPASVQRPAPSAVIESGLPGPEPLSLQLAEKLYLRRDYEHALAMYDKLYRRLPATEDNQPLRDLLLLRIALCNRNSGNVAQADSTFRTVSLNRLPILRALARYHQSLILIDRERYLEAAAMAWQTMGLIEVIDYDRKWVSAVQQQCCFLVAEVMTRNLLTLCDADNDLPAQLWTRHPDIDPFAGMDEAQLRALLAPGSQKLDEALLSPQIRATGERDAIRRWSVICNGASIEELLARFTSHAGLNIRWMDSELTALADDSLRRRPVYLHLASATAQEVVTVAAGSVGLLARVDDKGNVQVLDPASYSSLAEHTKLLAEESASLWRRFLLATQDDQRAANSHFALGLLQTVRGQFDEAISEYKLVANRFEKHGLAPHALLHSGRLKVRLRDYVGAHEDFKQLVELYPQSELSDPACLYLADATMKAGLYEEATGLYRKVYNLGLSAEAQVESALGAGRCFHETGNYEEAAHWLSRYVTLARDQNRPEFPTACLLLGKTYLALHKPREAHAALSLALKGELSRQQHVETVAVLARTYIEQGLFLDALQTLEAAGRLQLSQQETIELLLLRAQVFRSLGLTDKAIALLGEKGQFLPSAELKGKVAVELARCYTEAGNLEPARRTLSEAFTLVEPGPLAHQIGCELVRTCLRLGQAGQAISLCTRMLEHAAPTERETIMDLLAHGYRAQARYDRAVAVLLDRYDGIVDPNNARN